MSERLMVRIYLSESDHELRPLLHLLHDELEVCGVTVLRGIEGYGDSGRLHAASLVDLSLDLPLVVEFFDVPERARAAIDRLKTVVKPGHLLSWPVTLES